MTSTLQYRLLYSAIVSLFCTGCTEVTYSDLEDEMSYLYPDEEELFEEEDQAIDCRDTYYDWIALHCWPKFHFVFVATNESNQCLWETIGRMVGELVKMAINVLPILLFIVLLMGIWRQPLLIIVVIVSIYGELALCTGLLAEGMGCPTSSPTLDAFFVKIHNEYFANCSLPTNTFVAQPPLGTVTILTSLTVCLVPISVVLVLRKV